MSRSFLFLGLLLGILAPIASYAEPSVQVNLSGSVMRIALDHDASAGYPSLGSPTSVLFFEDIIGTSLNVQIQTDATDLHYARLGAGLTAYSGGRFIDRDYYSGQVLFSETYSEVDGSQFSVSGAFGPSFVPGWTDQYATFRPYVAARVDTAHLNAKGLTCGTVCSLSAPISNSAVVISQDHLAAELGVGARWEYSVGPDSTWSLDATASAGKTRVNDSHHRRADLGTTPNVIYDFTTFSVDAALQFEHQMNDNLALTATASVHAKGGWGEVQFGPNLATPFSPYPATLGVVSASFSGGILGKF